MLAMANAGNRSRARAPTARSSSSPWARPRAEGKHTIFGEVADGPSRAVVDEIADVPTGAMDKPRDAVVIESVAVEK